jgi:ribonuclease R
MAKFTQSVADRIQEFLADPEYRPLKQHELARALNIKGTERASFRHALYDLERQGLIACLRKNRWALPDGARQLIGQLRVHTQGFGFVTPDNRGAEDVFIPEEDVGTALDGDKVVVILARSGRGGSSSPGQQRPVGRIERVMERRHSQLVGLLKKTAHYWYLIPDNPRIPHNVRVREFSKHIRKPEENHKVVVVLDPREETFKPLSGIVTEDLGLSQSPGVDMLSVLRSYKVEEEFSEKATAEAAHHSPALSDTDLAGRRDLRELVTFTIDPEDAKDHDDAVSLSRTPDGLWLLGVHIADVPHFVRPGSRIDQEAFQRGNSVYLVDRTIPMLPRHLTTEICSLQPFVDRLTHTANVLVDDDGHVHRSETFPSVIKSSARLHYDQVQSLFDNRPDHGISPVVQNVLADMRRLAEALRRKRMAEGSIDLTMPEVKCELDAKGKPIRIFKRGSSEAYHLIEEFMLAANCVVARLLHKARVPALYRIHEPPDEAQWLKMQTDLRALGLRISPHSKDSVNRIAREAAGSPREHIVHLAILRNLKRAVYSSKMLEHFGLSFSCYTHFTSPIRRYPDLAVHRILLSVEAGREPPYDAPEVRRIAEHSSETERNADQAEQESVDIKRIEFYREKVARRDLGPFDGVVVSIIPKGLIVELSDTLQQGLLPFSSMLDDVYVMSQERNRAIGRRRRKSWTLGDRVTVCLARVDTARRLVDFFIPTEEGALPQQKRKRK